MNHKTKSLFLAVTMVVFICIGVNVKAVNVGDSIPFNVEPSFDLTGRSQIQAVLVKTSASLYFYVEQAWWEAQSQVAKNEILDNFDSASFEFDTYIYPTLVSLFGSEWRPGIDNDNRLTLLFHKTKEGAAGYFRSADEYIKLQVPASNEREMLYLSVSHIAENRLKIFIAHEFTHLIEFNQKNRISGVQEEIWLNEARADFASTLLGYDTTYENSNLQLRVRDFLQSPTDSLTEWRETKFDYAVINMFMHYLVDHYDIRILSDSLKSKRVGIDSINEALRKAGYKEDFAKIFINWTIAIMLNDCGQDTAYCYFTKNLSSLRINPTLNFLPLSGSSSLSVTNVIKNWSANWQKIIGGNGDLKLQFTSLAGNAFSVPYIVFDKDGRYLVQLLNIDSKGKGEIDIKNFGNTYSSLVIIPSLEEQFSGFNALELSYAYTFTASISGVVLEDDPVMLQSLLAQIESLKKQIANIQAGRDQKTSHCQGLITNLYLGVQNKTDVICLQQFLKDRGDNVYPEGLITGNFGTLTKSAVRRFQKSSGLPETGFVGILTRAKINELMK